MFQLSCFADEISPDLMEQAGFMKTWGIRFADLRGMWDRNVMELTDEDLVRIRDTFGENGVKVSAVASPIGKRPVEEDFSVTLRQLDRAIRIAHLLGTSLIRVFSFYISRDRLDAFEEEVVHRFRVMAAMARDAGVTLIHENDAGLFGETSIRSRSLLEKVNSPHLRAVFDPSNFLIAGEDPETESYPRLSGYLCGMHVKDSVRGTGQIVIAGRGDARIPELLTVLKDRKDFVLSLEPHLDFAGEARGFTGPDLFRQDLQALETLLSGIDAEWV